MKQDLELVSDVITVNIKHVLTTDELAQRSQQLAQTVQDKAGTENSKKVAMSGFSNQIKQLDAEIKVHSDCVANGFIYKDVTAELYRDYERSKRVYILKGSETIIKEEDFRESDYQKAINFDGDDELTALDINRQQQIEENNRVGEFAEGGDALDNVIGMKNPGHVLGEEGQALSDKVKKGVAKEKPTPKNNLGDNYGKNHEPVDESNIDDDDELPQGDDLFDKVTE